MKVRAIAKGYIGGIVRNPGDVFEVDAGVTADWFASESEIVTEPPVQFGSPDDPSKIDSVAGDTLNKHEQEFVTTDRQDDNGETPVKSEEKPVKEDGRKTRHYKG